MHFLRSKLINSTSLYRSSIRRFSAGQLDSLVSPKWLLDNLYNVKVVDASWFMPADNIDAHANFLKKRIPGSVFFDVDKIADHSANLPHMMPSEEVFSKVVGAMGISDTDAIVIYDQRGIFSAPRCWYTFKVFGAENVGILNGGLPSWLKVGPLENGPLEPKQPAVFKARLNKKMIVDLNGVLNNLKSKEAQMVDARSAARFNGTAPEPRAGLKGGHIPGSKNVNFADLLTTLDSSPFGTLKSEQELRQIIEASGLDIKNPDSPIIATCGSGMTACVLLFALHRLGHRNSTLYDGSWTEWGARSDVPIAK